MRDFCFSFSNGPPVMLAPMAGATDPPFRRAAQAAGARYTVSEIVASEALATARRDMIRRVAGAGTLAPLVVQLAGRDPVWMAKGARLACEAGADVIDINMGCPAKKVCNRLCGSALMQDEPLIAQILEAVVAAVGSSGIPVTLKTRTGWDREHRNGPSVARIAEASGIAALAIHGRTRADFYEGSAEYDTIRAIRSGVRIPVLANGDIDSAEKAQSVLACTGASGVMIGRAAHGAPWIFRDINGLLTHGSKPAPLSRRELRDIVLAHLQDIYAFHGEESGLRIARKHLGWYSRLLDEPAAARARFMAAESTSLQFACAQEYFDLWSADDNGQLDGR